jgi:hypothetical protein
MPGFKAVHCLLQVSSGMRSVKALKSTEKALCMRRVEPGAVDSAPF